jgi:hypothetical protein
LRVLGEVGQLVVFEVTTLRSLHVLLSCLT